jgi:hypothetical protein
MPKSHPQYKLLQHIETTPGQTISCLINGKKVRKFWPKGTEPTEFAETDKRNQRKASR